MKHSLSWLAMGLLILFACWRSWTTPTAAPADAPGFSAERAKKHVEFVAQKPRPMGATHHGEVRDYLVGALRSYGLEAEVQKTKIARQVFPMLIVAAEVENVVGVLPGRPGDRSVLVMAHYDSVQTGPGAGDNGAAVASALEVAERIQSESFGANVIFLFSDGEEVGLLGAYAFATKHPLARTVDTVLNFEGRGSSGPTLLFELGTASGDLVEQYASHIGRPITTSLAQELYKRMPNDTDFSVFSRTTKGLNFTFIGRFVDYHSATDTPENLSLGTLQHQGEQMLAMTRAAAAAATEQRDPGVYFDVFAAFVVRYPVWLAWMLAGLLLVAMGIVTRRAAERPRDLLRAACWQVAATVAGVFVAILSWIAVTLASGDIAQMAHPSAYGANWLRAGLLLAMLAAPAAIVRYARRSAPKEAWLLAMGWLAAVMAAVTAALVPGASYIFLLPAIGILLIHSGRQPLAPLGVGIALVATVPMLFHLSVALGLPVTGALGLLAVPLALIATAVVTIPRRASVTLAATAAVLCAVGIWQSEANKSQPLPESDIAYADHDAGQAWRLRTGGDGSVPESVREAMASVRPFRSHGVTASPEALEGAPPGVALDGNTVVFTPSSDTEHATLRFDKFGGELTLFGTTFPVSAEHSMVVEFWAPKSPVSVGVSGAPPSGRAYDVSYTRGSPGGAAMAMPFGFAHGNIRVSSKRFGPPASATANSQ